MSDELDAAPHAPGFYDLLRIADPNYNRSEALTLALEATLAQHDDHPIIRIAALANLAIAYLRDAPPRQRNSLTESLLDDIRAMIPDA